MDPLDIKIYYKASKSLKINATVSADGNVLARTDITTESSGVITLSADLDFNVKADLSISTDNNEIYNNYVLVEFIEFDNFLKLKSFTFNGTNKYDQNFLDYVKTNRVFLEEQTNNNCLFFTGSLVYTISSPLSRMFYE